jgi:hypothetical protein|tara:strand:+ start:56 stop:298 length:243 start_codon:yes stop_codon:yes gene_type:complete
MNTKNYLTRENYIAITSELAENLMRGILKLEYDSYTIEDKEGNEVYTEEGQEVFEECLEQIEGLFNSNNIFIEGTEDKDE